MEKIYKNFKYVIYLIIHLCNLIQWNHDKTPPEHCIIIHFFLFSYSCPLHRNSYSLKVTFHSNQYSQRQLSWKITMFVCSTRLISAYDGPLVMTKWDTSLSRGFCFYCFLHKSFKWIPQITDHYIKEKATGCSLALITSRNQKQAHYLEVSFLNFIY